MKQKTALSFKMLLGADLPESTTTSKQPHAHTLANMEEVVQHSSACSTTPEHTHPAAEIT